MSFVALRWRGSSGFASKGSPDSARATIKRSAGHCAAHDGLKGAVERQLKAIDAARAVAYRRGSREMQALSVVDEEYRQVLSQYRHHAQH